jgi:hypothetical protein
MSFASPEPALHLASPCADCTNADVSPYSRPWPSDPPNTLSSRWPVRSTSGANLGTSKRYADSIDQRMAEGAAESVMRNGEPDTLTPAELSLDKEPMTRAPVAQPVRACVRYGPVPLLIDAAPLPAAVGTPSSLSAWAILFIDIPASWSRRVRSAMASGNSRGRARRRP